MGTLRGGWENEEWIRYSAVKNSDLLSLKNVGWWVPMKGNWVLESTRAWISNLSISYYFENCPIVLHRSGNGKIPAAGSCLNSYINLNILPWMAYIYQLPGFLLCRHLHLTQHYIQASPSTVMREVIKSYRGWQWHLSKWNVWITNVDCQYISRRSRVSRGNIIWSADVIQHNIVSSPPKLDPLPCCPCARSRLSREVVDCTY